MARVRKLTVKEVINELSKYDENLEVFLEFNDYDCDPVQGVHFESENCYDGQPCVMIY